MFGVGDVKGWYFKRSSFAEVVIGVPLRKPWEAVIVSTLATAIGGGRTLFTIWLLGIRFNFLEEKNDLNSRKSEFVNPSVFFKTQRIISGIHRPRAREMSIV